MAKIVVFEDQGYKKLIPLTRVRPACDLKLGILSLFEKIENAYGINADLHVRNYLTAVAKKQHKTAFINTISGSNNILFVNGRILAPSNLATLIPIKGEDTLFVNPEGEIVAVRISKNNLEGVRPKLAEMPAPEVFEELKDLIKSQEINIKLIKFPWELIALNGEEIQNDITRINKKAVIKGKVDPGTKIYNKDKIFIEDGAEVEALCVLDARKGPIYIAKNALVKSFSLIEGPAFIGEGAQILSAQIRPGTSIGPFCKIGGEVSASIILGYSNKAHYGFLGHAYLGEWVNLGAGTTNSNLKNTYGKIKIWNDGTIVETKEQFLGCIIGDHVKTGIGTMINTGTVIDVVVNLFGPSPTPKYVPAFTWGEEEYQVEKVFETARLCAQRRNIVFDEAEKDLFNKLKG